MSTRQLRAALELIAGATYDSSARPAEGTLDCTRFGYAFLLRWLGPALADHKSAMHIASGGGPWENIEALLSMGVASEPGSMAKGWWYCQGWRQLDPVPSGGHCWIWCASKDGTKGLILQATNAPHPWVEMRTWEAQCKRFPAGVRAVRIDVPWAP